MKDDDDRDVEDLGAEAESGLFQLAQRRKWLLLAFVLGLLGTALVWFLVLWLPGVVSDLLDSGVGRIILGIQFVLPFLSVFALGNLLFPRLEEGREIESGIMSGYNYQQKSDKRWHIFIAAGMCGALNCALMAVILG
jgi:hypothetical protein